MFNENEKKKIEIIKKIIDGKMTRKEAMFTLGLTRQSIYNLMKKYKINGEKNLIHNNRGKISPRKIDTKIIESLENLYLDEYFDYNLSAFYDVVLDKYSDIYKISYDTMLKYFKKDDIISPLSQHKTFKVYTEKMNNAINEKETIEEEKVELFQTRQIAYEQAHTRRSNNNFSFGQEIQMDACEKKWFNDEVSYLHLAVDKGTKKVLFGWFEYEELTRAYFILLYNMIVNYGIPERIKTDNRNSFSNQDGSTDTTQFGIICNMLNIELITTSVSTAKANVERENKTFKDRLIAELRHEGVTNIDDANKYLNELFIPKMNRKFSYQIDKKTSKMRKNNYTDEELNLIISEKYTRIIDNASSIKYNNKYYLPVNPETGEITCFMKKTECLFIITYNSEYWCKIEDKYYKLLELENRDSTMKKESENKTPREKIKYIPPIDHPWRKFKIK